MYLIDEEKLNCVCEKFNVTQVPQSVKKTGKSVFVPSLFLNGICLAYYFKAVKCQVRL